MAIFWTMHQVHHSSEFFNYSVPFRLPHLHDFVHFGLFYAPLALLGVPVRVAFIHKQLNLIYQFWTHSDLVPKLPWPIELIFNTPSHHRVHHARQARYLDKNYGAVFIVWDRLFGTFCEEDDADAPSYGITVPQRSLNVLTYQVAGSIELFEKFKSMDGWRNKVQCLIKGPGWEPGSPWTGFIDKVPVPDPQDKPVFKELSTFWEAFLFADLIMMYLVFIMFLCRFDQIPHSSFYLLIIVLYYQAHCAAKTLEGDVAAAGLQALKFVGLSFLVPFGRSIFSKVSALEYMMLNIAELLGFSMFLSLGLFIVMNYNAKRKLQ
ncbi:alkylglycerol monooxygenase-like [Galendromus occidentalis]|uniref:Alkylglycerol monooxygenase-like n=1 Tax=Galendromus occidentalis TaxID=34638 RepID=A0AAJ7SH44_9ACAR|nr:alkylglycerol monooxygenase-like [Galendromus occidentalis]